MKDRFLCLAVGWVAGLGWSGGATPGVAASSASQPTRPSTEANAKDISSPYETLPRDQWNARSYEITVPDSICLSEDCEVGLMKIGGQYVNWSTDWIDSYDLNYHYADSIKGPWLVKIRNLPYGGNGRFFRDGDGTWWYAYFMNTNDYATRAQNSARMNMYPLFVGDEDGELIIEPQAVRETRARLEKLGALWQSPRTNESSKERGKP